MQDLSSWTLQVLRYDASHPTWLEERKFEWIPLVKRALQKIFNGESMILITDYDREWFMDYVVSSINKTNNRPYVPILSINALFPQLDKTHKNETEIPLINDYLDNVFSKKYFFWYVGHNDTMRAKLALNHEDCFLWIFDTHLQNSFTLQSTDSLIDIRLMQMYRIFNLTLEAAIFGRVSLE
ncbi:HobA family DNA replication regulator [uncultured Helicobacter sp.]|uniref:HobA family DNA replication regulator n=1 Tax=uncultured Helicobacter sp. TaxID=175537 RepID=UPI00260E4678|nr:HobA family DNA replication regulator [uncultured Helicobacter sp.]